MKARLCLHGVDIKHQAQLLGLVKKLMPPCGISYKVKEKYFADNDMYKCRIARFQPRVKDGDAGYRVLCAWGVFLVSDKLINIADITLEFEAHSEQALEAVGKIVERLLAGKQHFVLDEPDLSSRISLLRGCYYLDKLVTYDLDRAESSLASHIPWQVYSISKLWEQLLLSGGGQRQLWRQLRVKLRRLRSVLSLVKPLLPEDEFNQWQQLLKQRAAALSGVREYDVLLQTCTRLRMHQSSELEKTPCLNQQESMEVVQSTLSLLEAAPNLHRLLQGLRQQAQVRTLQQFKLNELTLELAQLLLFLQHHSSENGRKGLREFFAQRLGAWAAKIQQFSQRYSDMQDMEQLHRMRIKLKRFRYALQSVPEISASPQLLRSLKYLQDMLGVIHDDYVNERYLQQLVAAYPELPDLRYEVALLRGYEQAKADAALEQLSSQWEELEGLLAEWLDGLE